MILYKSCRVKTFGPKGTSRPGCVIFHPSNKCCIKSGILSRAIALDTVEARLLCDLCNTWPRRLAWRPMVLWHREHGATGALLHSGCADCFQQGLRTPWAAEDRAGAACGCNSPHPHQPIRQPSRARHARDTIADSGEPHMKLTET